ncbi:MAG: phosphoglycolate phosphatase [Burkholderiaceae bacterium]
MQSFKLTHPPRACVLDLDGTLVDTLGDFEVALAAMLHALGRAPLPRAAVACMVGKGSEHLVEAALQATRPAQADDADPALFDRAWQLYQAAYGPINGQYSRVYPGVVEGLQALRACDLPLAVLTNKPRLHAQALLVAKGLDGYFGHVFGGDSFARKKPDPLPLLETCRALGTPPAATLMIGDSSNDAAAARAAGCPVALLSYGYNHGQPVSEVDADGCFDSLPELVAALARDAAHRSGATEGAV